MDRQRQGRHKLAGMNVIYTNNVNEIDVGELSCSAFHIHFQQFSMSKEDSSGIE
jgi:hypothetical protein